jgi:hypothetical protein
MDNQGHQVEHPSVLVIAWKLSIPMLRGDADLLLLSKAVIELSATGTQVP